MKPSKDDVAWAKLFDETELEAWEPADFIPPSEAEMWELAEGTRPLLLAAQEVLSWPKDVLIERVLNRGFTNGHAINLEMHDLAEFLEVRSSTLHAYNQVLSAAAARLFAALAKVRVGRH